jgi:hypothetical protein
MDPWDLIWPFVGVLVTVALLIGVVVLGLQSHPASPRTGAVEPQDLPHAPAPVRSPARELVMRTRLHGGDDVTELDALLERAGKLG